ncbi:hypothetical protein DPMN_015678 [Dreissena polymorpha]|uniref:Uncharacterized protein n=1 Tax=Dreissena polymorpha TaxID=45954 RepID=A0A9D4ND98_DREPO|nr:hypothetical protein DPMN_015678 [Dreissena polymorpha]
MRRRWGVTRLHPQCSEVPKFHPRMKSTAQVQGMHDGKLGREQLARTANDNRKERIKFPASAQNKERHAYVEEVDMLLETAIALKVDTKLAVMATVMHSMGLCRFDAQEKRAARETPILIRHQHNINQLRGDVR